MPKREAMTIFMAEPWSKRVPSARTIAVVEVATPLTGWALVASPWLLIPDRTDRDAAASPPMMVAAGVVFRSAAPAVDLDAATFRAGGGAGAAGRATRGARSLRHGGKGGPLTPLRREPTDPDRPGMGADGSRYDPAAGGDRGTSRNVGQVS